MIWQVLWQVWYMMSSKQVNVILQISFITACTYTTVCISHFFFILPWLKHFHFNNGDLNENKIVLSERKRAKPNMEQMMAMNNWMRSEWKTGFKSLSWEEKIPRRVSSDDQEPLDIGPDMQTLTDNGIVEQLLQPTGGCAQCFFSNEF